MGGRKSEMKARLEIEMPSMCCYCLCSNSDMKCNAAGQRDVSNRMNRPLWCPLIPAEDAPQAEARCYLDMPCRFQTPI